MSMNSLSEKKVKKAEADKRNDVAVNRVMILFALTVIAVLTMNLLQSNFGGGMVTFMTVVLPIMTVCLGVLTLAALAWHIVCIKKQKDQTYRILKSSYIFGTALTLFVAALACLLIPSVSCVTVATVVMIAALVLCYVHNFYPTDFFLYSLVTAVSALFLLAIKDAQLIPATHITASKAIMLVVAALAICFAAAVLAVTLMARKGKLKVGKKAIRVPHNANLYPFFIGAVLLLAGTVLMLFFPIATIAIGALFAAYLVIAIIYSVKMM